MACYWFSSPDIDAGTTLEQARARVEVLETLNTDMSCARPGDRARLDEAVDSLEEATNSTEWREWNTNSVSVPFDVTRLKYPIRKAWSDSPSEPNALDGMSITMLRVANQRGVTAADIAAQGKQDREARALALADERSRQLAKRRQAVASGGRKDDDASLADDLPRSAPGGVRPLPDSIQVTARSSKVDFVLHEILKSDPADKFIIFAEGNDYGHLSEALLLMEIRTCYLVAEVSDKERDQALIDFKLPEVRVCVMGLGLGARGLNLTEANRVIFLRPLWSSHVFSQAIARCHRLGQTRSSVVQILVAEDTIEEGAAIRHEGKLSEMDQAAWNRALIDLIPIDERPPPGFPAPWTAPAAPSVPLSPATPARRAAAGSPAHVDEALRVKHEIDEDGFEILDGPRKRVKFDEGAAGPSA